MKKLLKRLGSWLMGLSLLLTSAAVAETTPTPPATPEPMPTPLATMVPGPMTTPVPGSTVEDEDDPSILPTKEPIGIQMTAQVGDSLYLLTSFRASLTLWRWQKGEAKAALISDQLIPAEGYASVQEVEKLSGKDGTHAVSAIFSDGETLYGINHLNGLVFAIQTDDADLSFRDVTTLDSVWALKDSEGRGYYAPIHVTQVGDWMLWFATDRNSRNYAKQILAFNLKTDTVKKAMLPALVDMTDYKDGKVLLVTKASVPERGNIYSAQTYDPGTDQLICLGELPEGMTISGAAYSDDLDMLLYQDNTRIWGWTPESGAEQVGYIPSQYNADLVAVGDSLLYGKWLTTLRKGFTSEHCLRISSVSDPVLKKFSALYPEVPVYLGNPAEGDGPLDLRYVQADSYLEGLEKGEWLDLSGDAGIRAYTDALYPLYGELARQGEGVYGVPLRAESYDGWYINKEVMNAMGLKPEDIPTSLTGMCEFATRWNDEFAEKYPHFTLLNNTDEYRERLLREMLRMWSDYCQYNKKEITFDDPIFREALVALDSARLDKLNAALKQTNPEVSEYKQALIWTGLKDVGNWATYMEDFSDRIFIPLTLTDNTPFIVSVDNVQILAANAGTGEAEYVAAFMNVVVEEISDTYAYVLRSDKTEPVISPYYEEQRAYYETRLEELRARREESVNKATVDQRIKEMESGMAKAEYSINPSAIENYVNNIVPACYIWQSDGLTDMTRPEEVNLGIQRFVQKNFTVDEMIALLNKAIVPAE